MCRPACEFRRFVVPSSSWIPLLPLAPLELWPKLMQLRSELRWRVGVGMWCIRLSLPMGPGVPSVPCVDMVEPRFLRISARSVQAGRPLGPMEP
eukprot:9478061-Pyramimonas_sp.AAC.1